MSKFITNQHDLLKDLLNHPPRETALLVGYFYFSGLHLEARLAHLRILQNSQKRGKSSL
jgi:hypothetical protein